VSGTVGRFAFQLSFELSPIILQGGIAGSLGGGTAGGYLPIVALLEGIDLATGLLADGTVPDPDNFFAHFKPLPGASMFRQSIGKYPFANQTVAGNATITRPRNLSLLMVCPAKPPGGYLGKFATMMALQATMASHCAQGGTFVVVTPSYIEPAAILVDIVDASDGSSKQPQETWRWDFEIPLITLNQATQAQNGLMSKVTNGLPTTGAQSGPDAVPGLPPSGAAAATAPPSSGLVGTSVGPTAGAAQVPVIQAPSGGGSTP
jgi:hypothetical protein